MGFEHLKEYPRSFGHFDQEPDTENNIFLVQAHTELKSRLYILHNFPRIDAGS